MTPTEVIDVLRDSGEFPEPLDIQPVDGGVVNLSYRLRSGAQNFFVKVFELDVLIPSDRMSVYSLQARLASVGIAPQPVFLDPQQRFQVERWIDHTSLCRAEISDGKRFDGLANALWRVHSQTCSAPSLDLKHSWETYLSLLPGTLAGHYQRQVQQAQQVLDDTATNSPVLCHNDLALDHIAVGEVPLIFDWEYAAMGNRYFDLAASVMVNRLDHRQAERVYQSYGQLSGIPVAEVRKRTEQQQSLVLLTNRLWYAAAESDVKSAE